MPVKAINSLDEFRKVIAQKKPVVIDFWATWCGPCRVISPIMDQLSNKPEYKDLVDFYKVDVDEQEDIGQEVGIRAMPTFTIYSGGAKIDEFLGAHPAALEQLIKQAAELSEQLQQA